MIRMGVSGWMFLLVPAYPGCPGSKAVKRSLLLLLSFSAWMGGGSIMFLTCLSICACMCMYACVQVWWWRHSPTSFRPNSLVYKSLSEWIYCCSCVVCLPCTLTGLWDTVQWDICSKEVGSVRECVLLLDSLTRDTSAQLLLKDNVVHLMAAVCCQVPLTLMLSDVLSSFFVLN